MRTLLKFSIVLALFAMVAACGGDSKAVKADDAKETAKATVTSKSYTISEGTVYWAGSKVAYGHNGKINVSNGSLTAEGAKVTSGDFIIDMNSLENIDLAGDAGKKAKLEGHLKSGDFFDVEKFSTSAFKITGATPLTGNADSNYTISVNLTLKGVSKNISFPANVLVSGNKLIAVAPKFTINRNDWNVTYSSGLSGAVGDAIIGDDITLNLSITATAPSM